MGAQGIIPASGSTFQKLTKILIQRDPESVCLCPLNLYSNSLGRLLLLLVLRYLESHYLSLPTRLTLSLSSPPSHE